MMNVLSLLENSVIHDILDLLHKNRLTKEQIAIRLNVDDEVISQAISELSESGAVNEKDSFYELRPECFIQAVSGIMKYSVPLYGENDIIQNSNVTGRTLIDHLFAQREENFQHASFDKEVAFYESICTGDIDKVKELASPLCSSGYGVLSNNMLRNLKYHFVVSVAMITRFCISRGMTPEEAYNLSDVYIMKADKCSVEDEIHKIHDEMMISFTKRMRNVKNNNIYSKQVIKAIDYVSEHLHDKIKMQEVVDYLSLSIPYFSRLFKAEMGVTFSEYVMIRKVEVASNMIRFSDGSTLDISNILNFSSQSYFIKVFKRYTGMTPNEYKKKYNFISENLMDKAQKKQ